MARPPRPGAREALLHAAREEFARQGLERARVEDVARRAGVSKGAFYLHFRSKEDAFRELVQRFLGALEEHALRRQEAEDRAAAAGAGLADAAAHALRVEAECAIDADLLDLLWRSRQVLAALEGARGREARVLLATFRRRMRSLVARRIEERPGAKRLRRDVAPDVVADVLAASYEDLARRMIDMKERPDLAAWARSVLLVLYGGILDPSLTASSPARRPGRRAARA